MMATLRWVFLLLVLVTFESRASNLDLSALSEETQKHLRASCPNIGASSSSLADLDCAIRYLIAVDQFDSAQFVQSGENIKLQVGRTKRILQVLFTGMKSFSESDLRKEFAVADRTPFDQQLLVDAGERVRRYYVDHAFLNASIDLEFQPVSTSEVNVNVKVTENVQTTISEITVITDNLGLRAQVEKLLHSEINEPLTEATMNEIRSRAKNYFGDNRYLKSDLQGPKIEYSKDETRAIVRFNVERADLFELDFFGNESYTHRRLERELDLDNFFSSNPTIGPELATKLKAFYLANGYARVQVQAEEAYGDKPFLKRLKFHIIEGPRVRIKALVLVGHFSAPVKEYQDLVMQNSSELVQAGYYNRDDIETGLKNMRIERQNLGYFRAKVTSTRVTPSEDKSEVTINVNFDEGPLTEVEDIKFRGVKAFSEAELKTLLGLEIGTPLRLNDLEAGIVRLKNFYTGNGYLEMSLLNENEGLVAYNEDSTRAHLEFNINEGPQVIVGSILVEGNTLTKDYVVLKELEFKVDDVLTPAKLQESISRLQRLGHFTAVDIRTQEDGTQVSRRTIIVRVADREPGLFNAGFGVTSERILTLRGFLGVAYRNIAGTGRGASARIDLNYNIADIRYLEKKASVGYLEPYLLDTRTRGKATFTFAQLVNVEDDSQGIQTEQLAFTVEQDLTSHILLSFDMWNFTTYRNFNLASGQEVTDPSSGRVEKTVIGSVGPYLDIDFRDHPFNPTKGTFTHLSYEYADPQLGSSTTIKYSRALAAFTHYLPVTKSGSWVWVNSVHGGYLKNLSNAANSGIPYEYKGLILGGESTIRGYSPAESFPNNFDFCMSANRANPNAYAYCTNVGTPQVPGTAYDFFVLPTEATMYLLKSELRFPLYNSVGGAVFYDGGAVYAKDYPFPSPYRDAVGFATRYATPVGAVSLEWGFKLHRVYFRNESWVQFHFAIGTF